MLSTRRAIHGISEALNSMKKFECGYSTENNNALLINYNGIVYKVTLEALGTEATFNYLDELK